MSVFSETGSRDEKVPSRQQTFALKKVVEPCGRVQMSGSSRGGGRGGRGLELWKLWKGVRPRRSRIADSAARALRSPSFPISAIKERDHEARAQIAELVLRARSDARRCTRAGSSCRAGSAAQSSPALQADYSLDCMTCYLISLLLFTCGVNYRASGNRIRTHAGPTIGCCEFIMKPGLRCKQAMHHTGDSLLPRRRTPA